jgi:hypothetical protein
MPTKHVKIDRDTVRNCISTECGMRSFVFLFVVVGCLVVHQGKGEPITVRVEEGVEVASGAVIGGRCS